MVLHIEPNTTLTFSCLRTGLDMDMYMFQLPQRSSTQVSGYADVVSENFGKIKGQG